jgi:hypothetical protein
LAAGAVGPAIKVSAAGSAGPGCIAPCWDYTIENDTQWNPTATVHIVVFVVDPLAAGGAYFVKVVAPNGVEDAKFFTL